MSMSVTRFLLLVLLSSFLIGCGESHQPTTRETPAQPAEPAPAESPAAAKLPPSHPPLDATMPALGATPDAAPKPVAMGPGGDLELDAITLKAPETWTRNQPRSNFVLAEFSLPRAEGDAQDGRLTVSVAGGSVDANIDRWRQQFSGKPTKESKDEIEIAGVTVTVVDLAGTYMDQPSLLAPGVEREGYRMLAAIIPTGEQLHFIKSYGPDKTMEQQADAFRKFIQTLKIK